MLGPGGWEAGRGEVGVASPGLMLGPGQEIRAVYAVSQVRQVGQAAWALRAVGGECQRQQGVPAAPSWQCTARALEGGSEHACICVRE